MTSDQTLEDPNSRHKTTRRDVLKKGSFSLAALSAAGITVSPVSAEAARDAGFSLGDVRFVEAYIEHDVPDDLSLGDSDGLRRYSIDREQKTLGLVAKPAIDVFKNADSVVSTGADFQQAPTQLFGESRNVLVVNSDHPTASEKVLFTESEYTWPSVNVTSISDEKITVNVEGSTAEVAAGEKSAIPLETTQVTVATGPNILGETKSEIETDSVAVVPTVNIRYNGKVEAFGKYGHYVVPANPDDPFTQKFKHAREGNSNFATVERPETTLFIAKQGGPK